MASTWAGTCPLVLNQRPVERELGNSLVAQVVYMELRISCIGTVGTIISYKYLYWLNAPM